MPKKYDNTLAIICKDMDKEGAARFIVIKWPNGTTNFEDDIISDHVNVSADYSPTNYQNNNKYTTSRNLPPEELSCLCGGGGAGDHYRVAEI